MSAPAPTRVYVLVGELLLSDGTRYTHFATYEAADIETALRRAVRVVATVAGGAGGRTRGHHGARHHRGADQRQRSGVKTAYIAAQSNGTQKQQERATRVGATSHRAPGPRCAPPILRVGCVWRIVPVGDRCSRSFLISSILIRRSLS